MKLSSMLSNSPNNPKYFQIYRWLLLFLIFLKKDSPKGKELIQNDEALPKVQRISLLIKAMT